MKQLLNDQSMNTMTLSNEAITEIIFKDEFSRAFFIDTIDWLGEKEKCYGELNNYIFNTTKNEPGLRIKTKYWYSKNTYLAEAIRLSRIKKVTDYVFRNKTGQLHFSRSKKKLGGRGTFYGYESLEKWIVKLIEKDEFYIYICCDTKNLYYSNVTRNLFFIDKFSDIDDFLRKFLYDENYEFISPRRKVIFEDMIAKGALESRPDIIKIYRSNSFELPF